MNPLPSTILQNEASAYRPNNSVMHNNMRQKGEDCHNRLSNEEVFERHVLFFFSIW